MEKLKLYLGGSLFTEAERDAREKEYKEIKENLGDLIDVYSPMHNDEINDKSKEINSEDIFLQDTREVLESDFFYCNVEEIEKDPGLAMEVGIATGCNLMLDVVDRVVNTVIKTHKSLDHNEIGTMVHEEIMNAMLSTIPNKKIYINATDIRLNHNNPLIGLKKDASVNQFCLGGLEVVGATFGHSTKDTVHKIKKDVELVERLCKLYDTVK